MAAGVGWEAGCLLLLCVTALVRSQEGCIDCSSIGTASCSGSQCVCQPGVTGRNCDVCITGYTGFSTQGCRQECGCDPLGSVSTACSDEGRCECHSRASGAKCDMCSVGYHMFSRGCITCPPCFDGIPLQYSTALELYQLLQTQLSFTLEGGTVGVSPALLAMLMEYEQMLRDLLQRVTAALMKEQVLTAEEVRLSNLASLLRSRVEQFLLDVSSGETELVGLIQRLNSSHGVYEGLLPLVQVLRNEQLQELRTLMEEARLMNGELFAKLQRLQEIASSTNRTSFVLKAEADSLQFQVLMSVSEAQSSIQRLLYASSLQNRTIEILNELELFLISVEDLSAVGQDSLSNISVVVPDNLEEARRALEDVLALSPLEIDFNSTSDLLDTLGKEVDDARTSADAASSQLQDLNDEFVQLNESAVMVLRESQQLDDEAQLLLERARHFFDQAQTGVTEGNAVINETEVLLGRLQDSSRDLDRLVEGLQSVVDNVERAEDLSSIALDEVRRNVLLVMQLENKISDALRSLEQADRNLQQTLRLSTTLNATVEELLRNSSMLSDGAGQLAEDVSTLMNAVMELRQSAEADQEAIAMVIASAIETILRSGSVEERIRTANGVLANLTQQLNETSLLPPGRLDQVLLVLTTLEAAGDLNQDEVDRLSEEVRRLQESADALRRSYTSLRQHRDLLQKMLSNVEDLDCTNQFLS